MICIDCLQFRPTRKSYWDDGTDGKKKKKKKQIFPALAAASAGSAASVDAGDGGLCDDKRVGSNRYNAYIRSWNHRASLQCPDCRFEEQVLEPRRLRIRLLGGSCPAGGPESS